MCAHLTSESHTSHAPTGVSIDKFHQMKAQSSGQSPLLTPEQQQWLTIQKMLAATQLEVRGKDMHACCKELPARVFHRALYRRSFACGQQ